MQLRHKGRCQKSLTRGEDKPLIGSIIAAMLLPVDGYFAVGTCAETTSYIISQMLDS